jgi:uncharacterized membrane protein YdbT with pleckstrin-like domain
MAFWKDKAGKPVTRKEFMERWKEGMSRVTPLQQIKAQILFQWITIIGLICGIGVSIWMFDKLWWVLIILVAAIGNTLFGLIGMYQRKNILFYHDNLMKQATNVVSTSNENSNGGKFNPYAN